MSLPAYPPLEIAKYEFLDEIGHGGMATVYRARDRRLGREVAIKVIHRHLRESPEVAKRFQSEALAVAKVKHPNIVEVYDVSSEDEAEKYLVVELIRGVTLRQLLLEHAPLPPEIAACITVEVCRGLSVAHREGVIHRDVKPENVLLSTEDGPGVEPNAPRVKLTDFGIAKLLDAQGVTHTGQVLGSPAHMAPEQIEGGDVSARADVFATGVLLYEMLTGVLPFDGKNPAQVLRKVLDGIFLPAERQLPRVGSPYGKIASQALARNEADRFPSTVALGDALSAELAELGITDVRSEVSAYLKDQQAYRERHEKTIPDAISRCASEARSRGDVVRAAALFNRALAYRPDNTQLLAEVAGLARRGRLKKRLSSLGGALLLLLGIAGAVYGLRGLFRSDEPSAKANRQRKIDPVTRVNELIRQASKTKKDDAAAPAEPALEVVQEPKVVRSPKLSPPKREDPPGTRSVRTPVVGPQNARVRIDGQLLPWFQRHTLSIGPHTFEFVPPNNECCETSPPLTVQVTAGEGDQVVRGEIKFRPATLRLQGPDGSRASCGIGGVIVAGGAQTVPMNRPSRQFECTLFPPPDEPGEPKRVDVDLRPGRTFTLTRD